jgi:hypothetical protein
MPDAGRERRGKEDAGTVSRTIKAEISVLFH